MRRLPAVWRVLGALLLGLVALRAIVELTPAERPPGGPRSSTFATGPDGLAAYADLLVRSGREVRRERSRLSDATLDPTAVLFVVDPLAVRTDDADALARFVDAGGTLVASGQTADRWLRALLPAPQRARPGDGPGGLVVPLAPVPEVAGVARVAASGAALDVGDGTTLLPVLGDGSQVAAGVATAGAGRVLVLADGSPLWNGLLAHEDNAAFGLALVPAGRRAVFAEEPHGYGRATGLGAVPRSFLVALAGVALAVLLLYAGAARRLGPVAHLARDLPPARAAYIDALARRLHQTHDRGAALAPLRAEGRRALLARGAAGPAADDDVLRALATARGLPALEIDALLGTAGDDATMLRVGRAVARLAADDGGAR